MDAIRVSKVGDTTQSQPSINQPLAGGAGADREGRHDIHGHRPPHCPPHHLPLRCRRREGNVGQWSACCPRAPLRRSADAVPADLAGQPPAADAAGPGAAELPHAHV